MIEQVFFIVISVGFFGSIFYLMISKNETGYLYFLGIQALGILVDAIRINFRS